jgi:hypothetical protein
MSLPPPIFSSPGWSVVGLFEVLGSFSASSAVELSTSSSDVDPEDVVEPNSSIRVRKIPGWSSSSYVAVSVVNMAVHVARITHTVRPLLNDPTFIVIIPIHDQNQIRFGQYIQVMSHQNPSPAS